MREPAFTVDGTHVFFKDGNSVTVTKNEALFLSALKATWPRVATFDFIIQYVYDGQEPAFAKNNVVHLKCSVSAKLKNYPVNIARDYGLGYRLVVTDPPKPDMEILRLLS